MVFVLTSESESIVDDVFMVDDGTGVRTGVDMESVFCARASYTSQSELFSLSKHLRFLVILQRLKMVGG